MQPSECPGHAITLIDKFDKQVGLGEVSTPRSPP